MVKSYNFATSFNSLIYYRYTLLQNGIALIKFNCNSVVNDLIS